MCPREYSANTVYKRLQAVDPQPTLRVLMNALRLSAGSFPLRSLLLACLFVFGCAHPHLPIAPDMALTGINTAALKDKVIVIDPGHGGPERGPIGVHGLAEAEVNLTVALHLWGLPKQAGAQPVLTRSADQALDSGAEFNIRNDLELRSRAARAAGADLFVSVHHNASLDRSVNTLIVFYAMADQYRSRDAACAVGEALQRRLGSDSHSVQPGNYTVLRSGLLPAILGEASFISNPGNEMNLAFARTLAAEARGYFDGILAYFSRGVPEVSELGAVTPKIGDGRPAIRAFLDPGRADAQVERGSISATINGAPVKEFLFGQNCLEFISAQLPNGRHRACVAFRNSLGNAAQRCADITVDLPPHSIALSSSFDVIPPDPAAFTSIDILVLDRLGRPVIDNTPIAISTTAGRLLQADTATVNGRARAVLAADVRPGTATLSASAGSARSRIQVAFAVPAAPLLTIAVHDAAGHPISGAALMVDAHIDGRSDSYGYIQVESKAGPLRLQLVKPGYSAYELTLSPVAGAMTQAEAVLQPLDGGVFLNRAIMLDPEGESTAGMPVLETLKNKIEHAGGRAVFTWRSSPAPSYQERVLQAAQEKADVFLCVSAQGRQCRAGHYHRSAAGLELAHCLQEFISAGTPTDRGACAVRHSTHYAIIQTAMPAVELELPRKLAQGDPEAAAQAIYEALRQWLRDRSPQTH